MLSISPTQTSVYTLVSVGDSNNCQGTVSNESVIIAVADQPAAPITSALRYCQNDSATALTAIGDSLLWYTSAIGGIGSATIVPSTETVGVQQFWVSQMINSCESDRVILEVTIDPIPPAPIVSDINYFLNDTSVPLTAIGNQLLWYTDTSEAGTCLLYTSPSPRDRG